MTPKITENANKLAYLVAAYPEKTLDEVFSLFALPAIDLNTAMWAARELGYLNEPDGETRLCSAASLPGEWNFGPHERELEDTIEYAFHNMALMETDMEENGIGQWCTGYFPQDVLIAIKHLLDRGVLHEYEIEDGENKYIFYTLKENAGKLWARKQFKQDPLKDTKE